MGRKNGNRNCNVIMCQAHIDRGWLDSDVHRRARKKMRADDIDDDFCHFMKLTF